jgi:protein O-GlcNAc transferase
MLKKLIQLFTKDDVAPDTKIESNDHGLNCWLSPRELTAAGDVCLNEKNFEQAERYYKQAIVQAPSYADAYINLSVLHRMHGRYTDAIACLDKAKQVDPADAYVDFNLAAVAQLQGSMQLAIRHYQNALALNNTFEMAYEDLFKLQFQLGYFTDAELTIRQALKSAPQSTTFHFLLGNLENRCGHWEQAIATYQKIVDIQPNSAGALVNIGTCYRNLGDHAKAITYYRSALELQPDGDATYDNLLFCLCGEPSTTLAQYYSEAVVFGRKMQEKAKLYTEWKVDLCSGRRQLRVGLVSGDLRAHPVGFFLENILKSIDRTRIHLIAYSTDLQEDSISLSIKSSCVAWHYIGNLEDEFAAEKIYQDGIDILIDLSGHTGGNRLPMFCWKPAPVQVSWLGYFASTGIPTIDYLLADPISVPQEHHQYYTETIQYLPDTRFCFSPPTALIERLPAKLPALENGYITFACFQRLEKLSDDVIGAWCEVLKSLPQAKLRLQSRDYKDAQVCQRLLSRLSKVGIAQGRIMILPAISRDAYLAAHAEVDFILDTFPYTGGTTTCEALWMGVPTLTIIGNKMVERQGASLMTAAGYADWVAADIDDYISKAIKFGKDIEGLAKLREGMRTKVAASLVFNAERFSKNLETALFDMWDKKVDELTNQEN